MTQFYHPNQPLPKTSGIYRITCTANEKIYIGSSTNLYQRWNEHKNCLTRKEHHNPKLQAAWNKYGKEAFTFEVLELVLPAFLLEREQYWLDKIKPYDKRGFNIAVSAQAARTGLTHTPETRERLRITHLGNTNHLGKKHTAEARAKMSAANKGKPSSFLGKKHTAESLKKIGIASKGRKHTPETRAVISAAGMGHEVTPETREKLRIANTGYKHTPETRAKMSVAKSKTFIITEPNGTEHLVHGMRAFCREHGLNQANLSRIARGEQKQYKGWKARYASEEETN